MWIVVIFIIMVYNICPFFMSFFFFLLFGLFTFFRKARNFEKIDIFAVIKTLLWNNEKFSSFLHYLRIIEAMTPLDGFFPWDLVWLVQYRLPIIDWVTSWKTSSILSEIQHIASWKRKWKIISFSFCFPKNASTKKLFTFMQELRFS